MAKARWAEVALIAAGLAACAHLQSASQDETSASYLGGQAAPPSSWIVQALASSAVEGEPSRAPAGQAAQSYSWIGQDEPATTDSKDGERRCLLGSPCLHPREQRARADTRSVAVPHQIVSAPVLSR
jgi:hypothetical protein